MPFRASSMTSTQVQNAFTGAKDPNTIIAAVEREHLVFRC